jgi:hypothetical protein
LFTPEEEIWLQYVGFITAKSPLQVSLRNAEPFIVESEKMPAQYDEVLSDSVMLGKRAERFLSHYLKAHPEIEVLVENLQIILQKRTLGELDFIIKHSVIGLIHLELACKFYLLNPKATSPERLWCGPNNHDFLSLKKRKLEEHQFPLLFDENTRPYLGKLNLDPKECRQMLLFQSFCFLPFDYDGNQDGVNKANCSGLWMNQNSFESLGFDRTLFFLPKKTNWLIDPLYNREWHLLDAIHPQVQSELLNNNSPMLWVLHPDGRTERWFVVWW